MKYVERRVCLLHKYDKKGMIECRGVVQEAWGG